MKRQYTPNIISVASFWFASNSRPLNMLESSVSIMAPKMANAHLKMTAKKVPRTRGSLKYWWYGD